MMKVRMSKMPGKRSVFGRPLCLLLGALGGLSGCSPSDQESSGVPQTATDAEPSRGGVEPTPSVSAPPAKIERRKKPLSGIQVVSGGRRVTSLGGLVAESPSPDVAAENFRQTKAKEFGVEPRELVPIARRNAASSAK